MLKLHVVQAAFGDCLIVECGPEDGATFVLVDGGPSTTYASHLKAQLESITGRGGKLDIAMLSHVDTDHIIGLLDLFADLRQQRTDAATETISIDALRLNSFATTIDSGNDIASRVRALVAAGSPGAMPTSNMAVEGIGEGNSLRLAALDLGVPLNPGFAGEIVCVDDLPAPVEIGDLVLRVVGPTRANLEALRAQWLAWLERTENAIGAGDPQVASMSDRSVPNLSSIMVMAEAAGKRMLLTGDGRGDHLIEGLGQAGLLTDLGTCHVELLKLPHHGSDRNVTRSFFETITADIYVASADGKDGNPDLPTLTWIVETAKDRGAEIELVLTNQTPSSEDLLATRDPSEFGYTLTIMTGTDVMTLVLDDDEP